jgi:hypothetical protein
MCVVIDANTIALVFDPHNLGHERFVPLMKWVTDGNGSIVYGGTKYRRELKHMKRYFRLFGQLYRQGRVVILPNPQIDKYAAELKVKVPAKAFDDEHLVAIVAYSHCHIICTDDKAAYPYLKRQDLYPKHVKRPKIYNAYRHLKLCCDKHIVDVCRKGR